MRKITLHQVLSELKTIEKRITTKISQVVLMGVVNGAGKVFGNQELQEFEKNVKADYQSVTDLIKLQTTLKKALMKANAETEIEMNGRQYKIIDIIVEKENIKSKKDFVHFMKQQLGNAMGSLSSNNTIIEGNLQKILEATFGKDQTKATASDIEAVSTTYKKSNMFEIVDPVKLQDKIKELEKEIDEFEINADSTLSTVNAITTIEIE